MRKRLLAMLLVVATMLSLCTGLASAAGTVEEALGEVNIFNGDFPMNYLSMNGSPKSQNYTYFNYRTGGGELKEIPAYCINPTTKGVPQTVAPGESIKYLAEKASTDPKIVGIVANGYPHRGLGELKLENKYQAFYATKMALWCYLIDSWSIDRLTINSSLTGVERERAEKILAAAKDIYARGTAWTVVPQPNITVTADKNYAYPTTIGGEEYYQQVFTVHSETWVCDYDINVSFTSPDEVPDGTRIVNMQNEDITALKTSGTGTGYAGQFKVLYPKGSVDGKTGSAQLSFDCNVYKYAIYYALCQETDKYGKLQQYMCDTDPPTAMSQSAFSRYSAEPTPDPEETTLIINKKETGTNDPLEGALFEVKCPDGTILGSFSTGPSGKLVLPLKQAGQYVITEKTAPRFHLLGEETTKTITIQYGDTGEVTFFNDPYGTLRVVKVDQDSGRNLAGAVVQIRHIESGATYTETTDLAGCAYFDQLKPGAYSILEQAAPSGWIKDDQVHTVTVTAGTEASYTLKNRAKPGLLIQKYDRTSHAYLPDVTFQVWRDGRLYGEYVTNELGEILIPDVEPGTFLVFEKQGDDEHITETTPQQIELAAGDGIRELVFFNDRKPGLHLIKVDALDPSKGIPNAVFEIKAVDGSYGPEEFRTQADGTIDLSKLPAGAYVVTEKSCAGYLIDDAQRIIQLDPNENAQFVFTNHARPSLVLIKLSADGTPLPGVTFRIAAIADGSHYLDRTTDSRGRIEISDLDVGVYSVKETSTAPDHLIDPREHHVELFPGRPSTIVLSNDKRPSLTIHKNDAGNGRPVENCVFLVKAADGSTVTEVKTGPDGTATLENLLPIVYEISEKSVPEPYLLDAPSQLITLHPNRHSDVYFENHRSPAIEILKENSITHERLANVRFQVWYASNNTSTGELNDLGVFVTDENGRIELTGPENGLKDGWFRVKELEPPTGFSIKDSDTQEAFVAAGKGHTFLFQNTPLSALVVWKFDSKSGAAVPNCRFQLRYLGGETSGSGGTVVGTYVTSQNGSFTVTGLKAGYYICEELASDSGHVIDTAPQSVYISGKEQDVVQLYFGNSPKGSLLVKKVSSADQSPLSDVEFLVTDSSGAVVGDANGKFVTDSTGSFLVEGIDPGTTLVVKETRAKPGYLLDNVPQTAVIRAGQTVTLEFRNQPEGNLVIYKLSSEDKKTPLAGVQFKITYANGQVVDAENGQLSSNGLYVTDQNGQINLSITGTLVVTEVASIPGYAIDEETRSQTVVVNPADTQKLYFYNKPLCNLTLLKRDAANHQPLKDAVFYVTDGAGMPIGPNQGRYTSGSDGLATITGLTPDMTVVVREETAPPGYIKDGEPKTIVVKSGAANSLTFDNTPTHSLTIQKYIEGGNNVGLAGVTFLVTDSSGAVVGPNNGQYVTDQYGRIVITGLTPGATITAKEVKTVDGFVLDGTPQSILISEDAQGQKLVFYNKRVGGLELIKVAEDDHSVRIPDTEFEIRKMDGGLVGTWETDRRGRFYAPLEAGDYYLVETRAGEGYRLDDTPIYFTVADNSTTTKRVTNKAFTGILIHKVDSVSGRGVPGVSFLVYDGRMNPIDQVTTDQRGYAYVDDLGIEGKVYLRELEAEGYVVDTALKTVYVRPGETTEVRWENTPITGQIQIWKKSADDNPINGFPAGTPLEGAVFEIYDKANRLVDTVKSNGRGLAVSEQLPLGRYTVKEVSSPPNYSISAEAATVYLEHSGQVVQIEVLNKSVYTNVSVHKTGYTEVVPGQSMRYEFKEIANNSTVALDNFYWRDTLPTDAVRLDKVVTGTWSGRLNYKVVFRTNINSSYRPLADNLQTVRNYTLDASPAALGLASNEYVTEVMFLFGRVPAGFTQLQTPYVYCTVLPGLAHEYRFTNKTDVGGVWQGQWVMANDRWVTIVYNKGKTPTLPRTGY